VESNIKDQQNNPDPPLCVDLDGTLIRSDILWESIIPLIKKPLTGLRAFFSLLKGKAAMKSVLADHINIEPTSLPYREELLTFLYQERSAGRKLYLVTATHQSIADRIALHLGIFDGVLATDMDINLGGEKKRQLLEQHFGYKGYDYIGDHLKDLPVFASARYSILVEPSAKLHKKAVKIADIQQIFPDQRRWLKVLVRALRLHQWSKNALLGVPLITAHLITNWEAWINLIFAFISFSLLASATYLINDLNDLPSDRQHAKKRHRPLACGDLPIPLGILIACLLTVVSFSLAWSLLPPAFTGYLILYAVVTLAYSFDLKRRLVVDALTLAILYTLRIIAGGAAINVTVSEWLLMFSLFIFISLAFIKRLVELKDKDSKGQILGRGYDTSDLDIIRSTGIASGLMSVLVFTLYINSPAVNTLYSQPQLLWMLTPVLTYWIVRMWFQAERKHVNHDPIVYAMTDKRTYQVLLTSGIILILAKFGLPGGYF
jgi:4-hydroxybenzoate polyprenyltransferase/phosphoserine phosphatase